MTLPLALTLALALSLTLALALSLSLPLPLSLPLLTLTLSLALLSLLTGPGLGDLLPPVAHLACRRGSRLRLGNLGGRLSQRAGRRVERGLGGLHIAILQSGGGLLQLLCQFRVRGL